VARFPFFGKSVLIVEDEPLTIRDALELIGYAQICAAVVDVNLGGDYCSSICSALAKRSIPFMFYTGYLTAAALSARRSGDQQASGDQ
jgi:hypothetical protein